MTDPTPETTPTRDEAVLTVDALAQEIRRVDGSHSLGAGALAEALMPFILASAPAPASDRVDAIGCLQKAVVATLAFYDDLEHEHAPGEARILDELQAAYRASLSPAATPVEAGAIGREMADEIGGGLDTPASADKPYAQFRAEHLAKPASSPAGGRVDAVAWRTVSDFVDEMLRDWPGGDDCRMGFGLNGATVTKGQFRSVQAAIASLSPAATPVSEAGPDWMEAQQVRKRRGVEIMQEYAWGNLTPLGVANHLKRAGFNIDYAQKIANDLAKPASSPAPVRPIGNQGISDYQREIARNMAEGFAAWNAARQEALPSDEPASSPAGGDVATGLRAEIAHDGFTGDIIGRYVTREGKRGAVVQQDGTRVVHVYGEKWLPIETQMALSQSTSAGRVGE